MVRVEPPNFVIQELKGPHGALLDVFPGYAGVSKGYVYANVSQAWASISMKLRRQSIRVKTP